MAASLHIFQEAVRIDPIPFKDLVSSFVSILKQVIEHRLPRDFDYHRVPAPWLQMKMLRILAAQGRADQASSEQMYEVLLDVIRRGDTGTNVGYAILYECVKTVTTIYPNAALLDAAAASIARFITSESHNLKYLGVTGLAAIVKDHPKYAAEHQLAVIDCAWQRRARAGASSVLQTCSAYSNAPPSLPLPPPHPHFYQAWRTPTTRSSARRWTCCTA